MAAHENILLRSIAAENRTMASPQLSSVTPGAVTLTGGCHRQRQSQAERRERLARSISGLIDQRSHGNGDSIAGS